MIKSYKEILYQNYVSTHNSHLYGKMTLSSIEANFKIWDWHFKDHLPVDKDSFILDIGCGNGSFVYYLQKRGYSNASGIDVSAEQIKQGADLGIPSLSQQNIIDYLKVEKGKYSMIIARDVIEHFDRQEVFEILHLVSKSLKDAGTFVMQVPNGQGIFFTSIFYGDYTHEMAYTESSVRQLFLNCNFKSSKCFSAGPVPHSFISTVRYVLWKAKVWQIQFWKMVETGSPSGIFTSNLIAIGTK
jgi:cyclopropane fatty-acyl-phospholipid synthase-like methyltransferase